MNITYHSFKPYYGYGIAAIGYINLLKKYSNHKLNWMVRDFNDKSNELRSQEFDNVPDINFMHITPNYVPNVLIPTTINLLNTVFETNKFPQQWKQYLEKVDKIAVPCTWNQKVFSSDLNQKVYLLPHLSQFGGIEIETRSNHFNIPTDAFVFLTVSTWELRKNIESLVHAFCSAFTAKDNVLLVIKTSKNNITKWERNWYGKKYFESTATALGNILKTKNNPPNIKLIAEILSDEQMKELYIRCDAYITLSHGEGWGMGCYEAAWYGKPVIATGFGGYLDFLNEKNSFLLPYDLINYKKNVWDNNDLLDHEYANPKVDYAIDVMRYVVKNKVASYNKGKDLKKFVQHTFSDNNIFNYLQEFLFN